MKNIIWLSPSLAGGVIAARLDIQKASTVQPG